MPEPPSGGRSAGWLQRTRADLRKAGLRRTRCLDGLHRGLLRRDLGPIGSLPCLVTTELIVAGRFVHRVPAHDHVAHISSAFCAPAVPDRTVNRGWKWAASRQVASSMLSFSSPLPTSTIGWPSSVPIQNMYPRSRPTRYVCIAAVSAPEELQPSSARSSVTSVARITTAMGETWATLVQSSVYGEANAFSSSRAPTKPGYRWLRGPVAARTAWRTTSSNVG